MDNLLLNLTAVLRSTPRRFADLVALFPADALRRRPAPGEWSALECLMHLVDLDRSVFPTRVQALLAGQGFPAFDPDADGTPWSDDVAADDLVAAFERLRAANLALLEGLTPADLARTGTHAELGPVTLGHLLHEWGGHDLMHLVQAEQALMQPFIAGCGPWQVYFEAHVVRPQG